jgi:beta-N-acetylhexosaminidase
MEDILNHRSEKLVFLCALVVMLLCVFPRSKAHIQVTPDEAGKWVDETLVGLTLEKKIGQMICTDIAGGYISEEDPRLKRWVRLARDYGIGGFVLYGGTPRDVAHLLNRLQGEAELPILMSVDFEGGPGQQVTGASEFPANMAFAAAGSEALMVEAAKVGAIEGRAMGFHLTYTPVVDVSLRPENPAESVRSFGGDLNLLDRMVRAYVKGYQENGMLTTAKHFPGRGDTEPLPNFPGFNYIDKPAMDVEQQEFRAFKHAIDAGVTFVMSEHIAVPSVTDGSELPASVEQKLATGWLRDRLGFKGILTTDDIWYDHVIKRFGPVDVAIKAVEAGHDVILKPKDPIATIQGMVAAVKSGRISESRIDRSVRKLLYWKARLNLHKNRFVDEERVNSLVGIPAHLAVVQKVADQSLTLLKNEGILPIKTAELGGLVNICVQKYEFDPSPAALAAKLEAAIPGVRNFILRPDMDPAVYDKIWPEVSEADLVILSFFIQRSRAADSAPFRESDLAFIDKIIATKPKAVIAMSYGNPHLIRKIGNVPVFLVGYGEGGWYGNQTVYFDSFIKLLQGKLEPKGKLPVRVSDRYPIGSGLGY